MGWMVNALESVQGRGDEQFREGEVGRLLGSHLAWTALLTGAGIETIGEGIREKEGAKIGDGICHIVACPFALILTPMVVGATILKKINRR